MTLTLNKTTAVQVLTWIVTMLAMYADVIPPTTVEACGGNRGQRSIVGIAPDRGAQEPVRVAGFTAYELAAVEKSR